MSASRFLFWLIKLFWFVLHHHPRERLWQKYHQTPCFMLISLGSQFFVVLASCFILKSYPCVSRLAFQFLLRVFFPFLPSPLLSPPHLHLFLILYYLMYSSVRSVLVRLLPLLCPCSPVSLLHPPPCSFSVQRDSTLCSPSVSPRVSHWYVS